MDEKNIFAGSHNQHHWRWLSQVNSPWLQGVVMVTSCMQHYQGEPGAPHPHWYDSPSWGRPFSGRIRRPVSDPPECQVHGL